MPRSARVTDLTTLGRVRGGASAEEEGVSSLAGVRGVAPAASAFLGAPFDAVRTADTDTDTVGEVVASVAVSALGCPPSSSPSSSASTVSGLVPLRHAATGTTLLSLSLSLALGCLRIKGVVASRNDGEDVLLEESSDTGA